MKFTHLHVHSHYSLLDGLPKIDELLDYVKELGMDSVALTDHGVLYGAVKFYKKAKERGIKPIIGAELYVALEGMDQKRPNIDDKRYHLVLLAKNEEGYKNLVKLITKAHLEGFYYKPRIDDELLAKHAQGLICLSGCVQGKIPRLILAGRTEEAKNLALKYQEMFGQDNFYLEIQDHPNLPEQVRANSVLIELSRKFGIPLVPTNDIHYLKLEDADAQDILMLINTNSKSDDPERLTMKADDFSMRTPGQMLKFCEENNVPEAIDSTERIVGLCNFEFKLGQTKLPSFPVPDNKSPDAYLKELCGQGLEAKKEQIKDQTKATERLNYELSVIENTGFAPYFLIVQDFVNWAKQNRIVVGPGRGSIGGSLIAFLLNITEVDPLKHDLLFERFLNKDRIEMPDIDLDFADRRRDEVIEYVSQKYGKDRVAQIITFGTMAARAVIRDVGRAMKLSYGFCDQTAKMIPFGMTLQEALKKVAEFRQFYQSDETGRQLIDTAKKLEGVARHASTHACGVVIAKEALTELVPLQHPTQNDENIVTQYEMHSVLDLGLLKMDLLGLKNLTIIEDALAKIYAIRKEKIDIAKIPFDDEKSYQLFQQAQTTGVFQCESQGFKRYLEQLKPTVFDDIIAMVALYRPGPIELIPEYIARKHGRKKIEYIHPSLEPVLKTTYGLPIFQEQIMQIARTLAGFSLSEADVLRKAIGKKIRDLLEAQREKFIQGCIKNNVSPGIAKKVFQWIEPHASYSFNKSHATAYAMIAYETAYLKEHYPPEFMASLLTAEKGDVERIAFLIEECKNMNIEVLPPDVNESYRQFSVVPEKKQIRFGLLAIKNVGHNVVEAIVKERKEKGAFKSVEDFIKRMPAKEVNKRSLESLIKTGCFDKMAERNQLLHNLEKLLEYNRERQKTKENGQKGLFDGLQNYEHKISLEKSDSASKKEKLSWEKQLLGLFVSSHPLDDFKEVFSQRAIELNKISEIFVNKKVRVGGIISTIKRIVAKNGKPMLFLNLEDQTDRKEIVVFPNVLEANPAVFQENKIVLISGRVDVRDGSQKIIADRVEEVVEE